MGKSNTNMLEEMDTWLFLGNKGEKQLGKQRKAGKNSIHWYSDGQKREEKQGKRENCQRWRAILWKDRGARAENRTTNLVTLSTRVALWH